jgi:putative transposase
LLQAERFDLDVIAYCFMPDHVHLLLAGASPRAELRPMISAWKQATGYHVGRALRGRLWQPDYFERVLREDESSIVVARYILENPIRAGLAGRLGAYPFAWCLWQGDALFLDGAAIAELKRET